MNCSIFTNIYFLNVQDLALTLFVKLVLYLSPATELEAVRAVFNEKEKELSLAVARVDQLTRQLQDLRNGRLHSNNKTAAAIELEKLRNELMVRCW